MTISAGHQAASASIVHDPNMEVVMRGGEGMRVGREGDLVEYTYAARLDRVRRNRWGTECALAVVRTSRGYREVPLSAWAEAQALVLVGQHVEMRCEGARCVGMSRVVEPEQWRAA